VKVLLIGNDAFLAQSLSKRFLLEEDQVNLLGDFSSDEIDLFPEKLRVFDTDISDKSAGDVFSIQLPEVVVYFDNAQKDFIHDMVLDGVNEHMRRFLNAFALATWQGVKRFIYVSTIDLYDSIDIYPGEESPVKAESVWESAHYLCEEHLANMDNTSNVLSLCLRTSTIYGPGQSTGNCEVVHLINQKLGQSTEEEDQLPVSGENDYIYIDDFCEAVYRSAKSTITGVLNIASGKKVDIDDLRLIISQIVENPEISISFMKTSESVDVTEAATVMDYITRTDIVKGIRDILAYSREETRKEKEMTIMRKVRRFFSNVGKRIKTTNDSVRILPFVENLVLFAGVAYLMLDRNVTMLFGFIDIRVLYILIMGAVFGLKQSVLSTALCVGLLFYAAIQTGYNFQALLYDVKLMSALFVFLLAGLIFGYIRDRANQKVKELARSEAKTKKQLAHIKEMYLESLKVKDSLQGQIFNSSNSYGRVFDMVYKLDSLDFNKLKGEIIRVTEEIMENRTVSLYMFGRNRGFLRLMAKSQGLRTAPKSIDVMTRPEIQQILVDHEIYMRRNIGQHEDIVLAAPIENDEAIIAILMIHEAQLEQLSLSYQNLLKITASLVSQSIERAYQYQQAQEDEWYIENTNILKAAYFNERILQAEELQEQGVSNYVLLRVEESVSKDLYEMASKMIREFDYVGLDYAGRLCILLTNTVSDEAQFVLNRLAAKEIYANVSENVG